VDRGDLREQIRIFDESAQMIRTDDLQTGSGVQHSCIITNACDRVGVGSRIRACESGDQAGPANLRSAPAAQHLSLAGGVLVQRPDGWCGRRAHRRQIAQPCHECPVDAILEPPDRRAGSGEAVLVRGRGLLAH
jgi:hypothetical protein